MSRRSVHFVLIALLLALALLMVAAAPAFAQQANPTARINTGALNVRSGPDYSFARVATLYNGQEVTLLAKFAENQWVKIRVHNGIEGWVNSNFIITSVPISSLPVVGGAPPGSQPPPPPPPSSQPPPGSNPPPGPNPTATVGTGALNVRGGPGVQFDVVAKILRGETVAMLVRDANSNWVLIRLGNGTQGWVNGTYLSTSFPITSLPTTMNPPAIPGTGPIGTVSTGALNVRTGPGLAYPSLAVITQGQQVQLISQSEDGKWLRLRIPNGVVGWANAAHIRADVPIASLPVEAAPPPPFWATVAVGALHVRSGPTTNSPVVATVTFGMELGIIGRTANSAWVKVQTPGGQVGWVNSTYITPNAPLHALPVVS